MSTSPTIPELAALAGRDVRVRCASGDVLFARVLGVEGETLNLRLRGGSTARVAVASVREVAVLGGAVSTRSEAS